MHSVLKIIYSHLICISKALIERSSFHSSVVVYAKFLGVLFPNLYKFLIDSYLAVWITAAIHVTGTLSNITSALPKFII